MAYTLLAIAVLILAAVPVGTAAFILGFIYHESPCVLCWEQRIGMILVALIGLFVLRYGARPKYVGTAVLVGAWGMFAGLRQLGLHAARDIGQGFAAEIMGAHTYTWSLFIFWVCVIMLAVLLMLLDRQDLTGHAAPVRSLRAIDRLAFAVFLVVVAGNIVQAFASTGPPPYLGQSDPVRFSFNPRHWAWSTDEWSLARISLRGKRISRAQKRSDVVIEHRAVQSIGAGFGNQSGLSQRSKLRAVVDHAGSHLLNRLGVTVLRTDHTAFPVINRGPVN